MQKNTQPFPPEGSKFTARYNGFATTISDPEQMRALHGCGSFGKSSLTRSTPYHAAPDRVEIVFDSQFRHRKAYFNRANKPRKVLVVPDVDDDETDYFVNLKVRYEIDYSDSVEELCLLPEEAYFLAKELGCLKVLDEGEEMTVDDMWAKFRENDADFVRNYIVYHYYRSRNWIVKSGLKFGGDYVLYKGSPDVFHAAYVVIIDIINEHKERAAKSNVFNHMNLHGLSRVCETAGKELLIVQLKWPSDLDVRTSDDIAGIDVSQTVMSRFLPE